MGLVKREYTDQETLITAENLNDIQDAVIALEDGLFTLDNNKSGEVITITDAYKRGFRSLSIYGKTTQDGTPTPDNPVDLVSVGDSGSITVNVSGKNEAQSMTIATPNGLPGIPVSSGGNYTDANGQQWVCDEIDFGRGLYVQRIQSITLDGVTANRKASSIGAGEPSYAFVNLKNDAVDFMGAFSHFVAQRKIVAGGAYVTDTRLRLVHTDATINTVDSWNAWLNEQYSNGTPVKAVLKLVAPIETPLPEETLAAYRSLYTYRDNTTVSNNASAYMDLEYVMDSKKYIDSLVTGSGTIVPATVE